MSTEPETVDISKMPDLLRIADEVRRTKEPRVLCRDSVPIAVLMPLPAKSRSRPRGKALRPDDALFGLIGIGQSGKRDISEKKHEYLAEAIQHEGQ